MSAPAPAAGDTKEVSSPKRRRTAAGKDNLKTKSLQVNEQEGVDTPAASPVSKRKKAKKDKEPKEPLKEPPKELPEPKEEPPEDPAADPFAGLEAQLEGLVDTAEELPAPKIEVSQDRQTEALKDAVAEGAWFSAETFEDLLPERYRESLGSPHQDLIELVMSSHTWWRPGLRSLVKNLADLNQVTKSELPKKMDALDAEKLAELLMRMQAAVEKPLYSFSDHLKPALARRIHVGTMDYMGGSHESYRRTFEFIEMTNTWHDVDKPTRDIGDLYRKKLNCSYKDPAMYKALAARAADKRDSFRMVVKVSCVATHLTKLQNVLDWWPALWQEKYQYLAPATVAFLWQFPPSFVYSDELYQRFERLVEFLSQEGSGIAKARHIVDFRDGSWYRQDVYDFLRQKRWCLAWLHLNNATGWASNLPSGWTDRVQTTNFCFCRLFGPDGQTHGTYDNKFLHELFDSCPRGTTTYVLFGNKETKEDSNPDPVPATVNAVAFRTIFTKMDFVERIRDVRYKGKCPRILSAEETLLINSFYLRFSQKARQHGIKVTSPVCSQWTQKYKPEAPPEKRSYEWYFPETGERLHLGLHDAKEEEDLWIFLRQLTGLEDLEAAKAFAWSNAGSSGLEAFCKEDVHLLTGALVRWSEKARMQGLLSSTRLKSVGQDGKQLEFLLSNNETLWLSVDDMSPEQDIWVFLLDLSRVPMESLVPAEPAEETDPWQDGSWKRLAKEMWERKPEEQEQPKKEEAKQNWWEDKDWHGQKYRDRDTGGWGRNGNQRWDNWDNHRKDRQRDWWPRKDWQQSEPTSHSAGRGDF